MMREDCNGCTACCQYIELGVGAMTRDEYRWLWLHGCRMNGDKLMIPLPCQKLVDGKCSIYEGRPMICRKMPVGGTKCEKSRRLVDGKG